MPIPSPLLCLAVLSLSGALLSASAAVAQMRGQVTLLRRLRWIIAVVAALTIVVLIEVIW